MKDQATQNRQFLTARQWIIPVLVVLLAGVIFALDLMIPLGVAAGVPYVAVVLVSLSLKGTRSVWVVALACSLLTALGFLFSAEGGIHWMIVSNRILALFAIWVTAGLSSGRKKTQEIVMANAARLNAVVNTAPDGIITINERGIIDSFNKAASAMFGYRVEEVVGQNVNLLMPEPYHTEHDGYLKNYKKTGDRRIICIGREVSAKRKDGTIFPIYLSVGEFTMFGRKSFTGILVDLSERKHAENQLAALDDRLQLALLASEAGVWDWNVKDNILKWDDELYNMYGISREDFSSAFEAWTDVLHPDDAETAKAAVQQALDGVKEFNTVFRIVHPQKGVRYIQARAGTYFDESGLAVRMVGINRDITTVRLAEIALRESEEQLSSVINSSRDAIVALNSQGKIFTFNPAASKMFGYTYDEAIGKTLDMLMPSKFRPRPTLLTNRYYRTGGPGEKNGTTTLLTGLSKDGTEIPIELTISRGTLRSEKIVICIIRDITLRMQAEKALIQARQKAEAAAEAKSTFLASMSHELRTPMNAILGYSQMLAKDPTLQPQHLRHVEIINSSGNQLLELINDVLEISKVEAGQANLAPKSFDLVQQLVEIEKSFELRAQKKGLTLLFEIDDRLPRYVETDQKKLRQVLNNLLSNALKFTHQGGVALRVSSQGPMAVGKTVALRFEVEDSGVGIAHDQLDAIFDPFTQTESGLQNQEGTGLGLAISSRYVQLMGGTIDVSSKPGQGSLFKFGIVATLRECADQVDTYGQYKFSLDPEQAKHRILLVEDNDTNRMLLRDILAPFGFEINEAVDGQRAVEIAKVWKPDLIFMDKRMPAMDGIEATRIIRKVPWGKDIKIVALTASAFQEEQKELLDAGCDAVISKPFREEEITMALSEQLAIEFTLTPIDMPDKQDQNLAPALDPGQLDALPAALLKRLMQAIQEGDQEISAELVDEIARFDADAARSVRSALSSFKHSALVLAIESILGHDK